MIYGDNHGENSVPDLNAIMQSGNIYAYCMNNPATYKDCSGESVVLAMVLIGAGLGALFGGLYGDNVAKSKGYSSSDGWDYYKYILGYGIFGATVGGFAGWEMGTIATFALSSAGTIGTAVRIANTATTGTSFGKLGTLIANHGKQIIDWGKITRHGADMLAERGVTKEMVETWVKSGKALQQTGDKILYITQQGAVVVNKAGQVITAYTDKYFDTNMVEVVKRLFGE